ncbi:MAG: caspase family protein, partial [Deltaproteobacteria bacterium]|nr:caspase family protein [Deltaproteobacteria bacterium]
MRIWRNSALALMIAVATGALPARAASERFALLVSNNRGGDELPLLRYAGRDSLRMREVLVDFGGFRPDHIVALENQTAADALRALSEVEARIGQVVGRGDDALLLFYFSGHAKEGLLRMGDSRLDMRLLKSLLEGSRARVRIALLDSCGAGAITREKGGQLAPPFAIAVDDTLSSAGQVIIASSSADEASQESDEIQGSFFTHYLATGLRGGADGDGDGRVSLAEAYNYTYSRTVAATAVTRAGTQHPTYEFDLRGAGDVILTSYGTGGAVVAFPAELSGRYFLVDEERQLIVAEIDKEPGAPANVALKGGAYVIKKRLADHLLMQRMKIQSQSTYVVDETRMERISFENDYAKGTPILESEIEHGRVALSLSLAAGAQVVFESPTRASDNLFPPIGFLSVEGRLHNLFRRQLLLSMDLGFG